MRRPVICILVFALLYCQCSPRHYSGYHKVDVPITISDVVGEVIDADERNHYDLFRGIDDFEEARFYPIREGGLVAEIQTRTHTLIAVNRDHQMHMILREYVENYDWITASKEVFERKWRIVDYDRLGFPVTKDEIADRVDPMTKWGCGLGTAAAIFAISYLIALRIASSDRNDWYDWDDIGDAVVAVAVFIGGIGVSLVGGLLGGIVGSNISAENALASIKESRLPEIKE